MHHLVFEGHEDAARKCGRGHKLEIASACVVAVLHARRGERVEPTEQVRDLQAHEQRDHEIDRHEDDQGLGRAQQSARHDRGRSSRRPE